MKRCISFFMVLLPIKLLAGGGQNRELFFRNLIQLELEAAKGHAQAETDSRMQFELLQLAEILFYEGQKDRAYFKLSEEKQTDAPDNELEVVRALNAGYISLFYDQTKGNAYKYFYKAHRLAKASANAYLLKASLFALLRYYLFEIAQNSDAYKPYLEQFEALRGEYIDEVWATLFRMIFYSKTQGNLDERYHPLAKLLDEYEEKIDPKSQVLVHVYFEKAIKFEIGGDRENSERYYRKAVDQAKGYPFHRDERFFSFIKLLDLETARGRYLIARDYLAKARREINLADTMRSDYYLNLHGSFFYRAQNKNDSAFLLLQKAYFEDFKLDFRRNTLEINRLNVELETQEKENANLRLRQARTWLISALGGVALLFILSYLAYANQRSRNKIQLKEKEVQTMKLEKLLKDHELFGIDAMIEGQEKERQRLANELHDNLGSTLAALIHQFQDLKKKSKNDRSEANPDQLFQKADDLLEEAYQKVRTMAHAGHAGVNVQDGLLPAIKNFVSKVAILNKLAIDVKENGMDQRLENSMEITIFRIIQELITNIIKHAHATETTIHLTQHAEAINIMVEDNGVGFDRLLIKPGETMGLYAIQKRIEALGGQVIIDSIPQSGTTIIIDIPLA